MPSRRLIPALAGAVALSLAAPAFADNVTVSLSSTGGTRQFSVEDLSGNPLTALDLGTGSSQAFKVHVKDTSFLATVGASNYSVSATMNNLYLKNSDGSYDYAVKVPSSELSIGFGSNPLSASGLSLVDLPKLSISGTLAGCSDPVTGLLTFANSLGLNLVSLSSLTTDQLNALTSLCNAVGTTAAPVTAVVDAALQNITGLATSSLGDLPTALSGATGGTFTNPSFASGTVGADDTAGASGAPTATSVSLMSGTQAMTSGLIAAIQAKLDALLTGSPTLVAASGSALTTTTAVTTALASAGSSAASAFGQLLQTLSSSQVVDLVNGAFTTLGFQAPTLSDISSVTGDYYSTPILSATPRTPVPGDYGGTMSVTFVQS